jgi:hypothetical protein
MKLPPNPGAGDVIPGLKGIRKIRFCFGGKGKRGGGRAIYIVIMADDIIYLLMAYAKGEKEDLTQDDKTALLEFIKLL